MSLELALMIVIGVVSPLLPAIVLYRVLPVSKIDVKGPFKGLQIRFTGAAAAYFIVFGAIAFVCYSRLGSDYELWTLEGEIEAVPGEDLALSISPPRQEVLNASTGAQFKISQVPFPIRQTGLIPHLVVYKVAKDGGRVSPETVPLEPVAFGGQSYTILKDPSSRTLRIKERIRLSAPVAAPYPGLEQTDPRAKPARFEIPDN